jgi:6-phosphogluconolactonase
MTLEVLADADAVAYRAADVIAAEARTAVRDRGRFTVAISGGRTPWVMLRTLSARADVPWAHVHVLQVDERIAPGGHADRNLTHLCGSLLSHTQSRPTRIHAMPVESDDLDDAALDYADTLAVVAGTPPVIDLVHLGLGADGHTASLVPGDPVLDVTGADVALTRPYQGRRRLTLTYPALNRARRVVWLITGKDKGGMLASLRRGDTAIPAGRVRRDAAMVLADRAAAGT